MASTFASTARSKAPRRASGPAIPSRSVSIPILRAVSSPALTLGLIKMRVVEQRDPFDFRQHLLDDLNPFSHDFRGIEEDTGHIAAWPIEALGGARRDRV